MATFWNRRTAWRPVPQIKHYVAAAGWVGPSPFAPTTARLRSDRVDGARMGHEAQMFCGRTRALLGLLEAL